ncbi:hypothetical protein BSL78_13310 [Apostichopus japonicus]|uniref:Uncharacterized protein n=1 Tax=Stichopus japonicus TaxID=307972 RepID=A0A2G8KPD4_STIJA|nr:hypothetical protein BSL78_13310 [Apostichopus japonicus]
MESYAKLPRHLFSNHGSEKDVQEVMSFDKKSKQRKNLLNLLRNKGNHAHNIEVIREQRGYLIPSKRPQYNVPSDTYIPCDQCFGYYMKSKMWKHVKNCAAQVKKRKRGTRHQSRCALLLPVAMPVEDSFRQILGTMVNDDISLICRNDRLILTFGQKLHEKAATESRQYISQKMRELGRFLKVMQVAHPDISCLEECISPQQYDNVVRSVRQCAGYDGAKRQYQTPSLALKLDHSLKRCAEICRSNGIKLADNAMKERAERFHDLCCLEWANNVSSHALTTLYRNKFNKPTILPLTDDVCLLHRHLSSIMADASQRMQQSPDRLAWYQLAEATLAKVILFNRRRSGEAERMSLSDYQHIERHVNTDIFDGLSKWEKNLCERLKRVEVRGKRGGKYQYSLH